MYFTLAENSIFVMVSVQDFLFFMEILFLQSELCRIKAMRVEFLLPVTRAQIKRIRSATKLRETIKRIKHVYDESNHAMGKNANAKERQKMHTTDDTHSQLLNQD